MSGQKSILPKREFLHVASLHHLPQPEPFHSSDAYARDRYYFGIPIDYAEDFSKTTSMFAFEVYGKREDLYTTHLSSPAMTTFLGKIPAYTTTGLDLNHYSLIAGYLDTHGDKRECGIMLDVRIGAETSTKRSTVAPKLKALAEKIKAGDKTGDVYTFMTFECLDNDTDLRIYARFKDRESMERTIRTDAWTDFWMSTKDEIAKMESRGYLPNKKGWLYREKPATL